jgi:hypothetical protein
MVRSALAGDNSGRSVLVDNRESCHLTGAGSLAMWRQRSLSRQSEHATLKPQLEQMSSHRTSCISFPQTGQTFVSIDMVMREGVSSEHISKSIQVVVRNRQNVKTTVAAASEYHRSEQSSLNSQLGHTSCHSISISRPQIRQDTAEECGIR